MTIRDLTEYLNGLKRVYGPDFEIHLSVDVSGPNDEHRVFVYEEPFDYVSEARANTLTLLMHGEKNW